MGLFAVEYEDVPGQGVIARRGLKFHATQESLSRYFAPILPFVSLNDLLGEAVFWSLMPSTIAVWAFPVLLYLYGPFFGVVLTLALQIVAEVADELVYIKSLNYFVFWGNATVQFVAYVIMAVVCAFSGHVAWALVLAGVFIFYASGLNEVLFTLLGLVLAMFVGLSQSDQLLRLIGWHYGRKYTRDDPTKWRMFDERSE